MKKSNFYSNLKKEEAVSSETLVHLQRAPRRYIAETHIFILPFLKYFTLGNENLLKCFLNQSVLLASSYGRY
jgi:hypothetical protein